MVTLVTALCFLSCCLLTHTDTFPFPNCLSSIFMSYFIFHWVRVSSNDFSKSLLQAHGCEVIYRSTDKLFRELYHWRKCLNSSFSATIKYLNSWASGNPPSKTGCFFFFLFWLWGYVIQAGSACHCIHVEVRKQLCGLNCLFST